MVMRKVTTSVGVREVRVNAPRAAHWEVWDEAKVVLYANARPLQGGRWAGTYTSVPVRAGSSNCDHLETVCPECVKQWQADYVVRFFDHGGNGYVSHGCRYKECRDGAKYYASESRHGRSVGC
jgi:hypothetical protein